jgi:lipopolysaccharide export system permease protein
MRILDRYIVKSFFINYMLALGVMVGMYTLLDLIVNFENFAKGATAAADRSNAGAMAILGDMADYYAYQLLVIFQQVSGAIPLVAAGFTMWRMTRAQELTAMLASGVSLYRVAAPIVLVSMAFSALNILNQEFVISHPFVIEKLLRKHDQVNKTVTRTDPIYHVVDRDNSLISAASYDPGHKAGENGARQASPPTLKGVFIMMRDKFGMPIRHTVAESGTWEVPPGEVTEAWVLRNVVVEDDIPDASGERHVTMVAPTQTYITGITPAQLDLIFQKKAVDYLSSAKLHDLIEFSAPSNRLTLEKMMHLRFTQPLMNIVMLLIGIPFLLTREPNRLVVNMFYCVAVSGVVFISTFVIFQMAGNQIPYPLLAAWLPVMIFGPFSLVMMDMIKT